MTSPSPDGWGECLCIWQGKNSRKLKELHCKKKKWGLWDMSCVRHGKGHKTKDQPMQCCVLIPALLPSPRASRFALSGLPLCHVESSDPTKSAGKVFRSQCEIIQHWGSTEMSKAGVNLCIGEKSSLQNSVKFFLPFLWNRCKNPMTAWILCEHHQETQLFKRQF